MNDRKEALLTLKQELETRIDKISKDRNDKIANAKVSDQGAERRNEEVLLNLKNEAQLELEQIDVALVKLKNGVYGICEKCHIDISSERLDAIPFATHCKECAE